MKITEGILYNTVFNSHINLDGRYYPTKMRLRLDSREIQLHVQGHTML